MTTTDAELVVPFSDEPSSVARARERARHVIGRIAPNLVDDAELVVSELATNALLHAAPPYQLRVDRAGPGVRVEVYDSSPERAPGSSGTGLAEVLALDLADPDDDSLLAAETMTGRGLLLIRSVATAWGLEVSGDRKRVWAEIGTPAHGDVGAFPRQAGPVAPAADGGNVRLAAVPARLVLESAANLDDVVREFRFAADAVEDLADAAAELLAMTVRAREPLRLAARAAVEAGNRLFTVSVHADETTIANLRRFLGIVEAIADHCGDGDLLSLAPSTAVVRYRRWYVEEIERQLAGAPARPAPFPAVDTGDAEVVAARAAADATVADTGPQPTFDLAAATDEIERQGDVKSVGAAIFAALSSALGASNASVCVADWDTERVSIVWAHGYRPAVITRWGTFGLLDDLPASEVIRTGRPVFFRTERERNARFPVFATAPVVGNEAVAIVPIGDRAALVAQFAEQRGFSPPVQRVLGALADATGRALSRIGTL